MVLEVVVLCGVGVQAELVVEVRVRFLVVRCLLYGMLLAELVASFAYCVLVPVSFGQSGLLAGGLGPPLFRPRSPSLCILSACVSLCFLIREKIWAVYLPVLFDSFLFLLALRLELPFNFLVDAVDVLQPAIFAVRPVV